MHVLLIEDDPLVASGIRSGLMMYHFVVEHVTSEDVPLVMLPTVMLCRQGILRR